MTEISEQLDSARDRLRDQAPAAEYLSVDEAARLAHCSAKTIRRAYQAGDLRTFRPTTRVLLREDDVRAWVERHAVETPERPRPRRSGPRQLPRPGSVQSLREIEQRLT